MRRLVLVVATVAVAAVAAAALPRPVAANAPICGFHPVEEHKLDELRHIGCAAAKHALLELRGSRRTIPMVCGRPRRIGGWWVEDVRRSFSTVINRYTNGRRSFVYLRAQSGDHPTCRPPYGSGE